MKKSIVVAVKVCTILTFKEREIEENCNSIQHWILDYSDDELGDLSLNDFIKFKIDKVFNFDKKTSEEDLQNKSVILFNPVKYEFYSFEKVLKHRFI